MPNWCENILTVTGENKELKKFISQATVKTKNYKTDFSINQFVPCPKPLLKTTAPNDKNPKEMEKRYGASDWYEWKLINWNVKWDVEAVKTVNDKEVIYDFDSPWGSPIIAIHRISKLYPKLNFLIQYEEPGMYFSGIHEVKNGKIKQSKFHNNLKKFK